MQVYIWSGTFLMFLGMLCLIRTWYRRFTNQRCMGKKALRRLARVAPAVLWRAERRQAELLRRCTQIVVMAKALDDAAAPYRSDGAFLGVLLLSFRQPLMSLTLAIVVCDIHLPWVNACKATSMFAFFLCGYHYSVPFGLFLSPLGLVFPLFPPQDIDADGWQMWVDMPVEDFEISYFPATRGCMELNDIEQSRAQHLVAGTNSLSANARSAMWGVLPVDANGECFMRVLGVEINEDLFIDNCRLLYLLAVESLIVNRETYQAFYAEDALRQQERLACIGSIERYQSYLPEISPFEIYCLDKLEGAFELVTGLRDRQWCDVLEISSLFKNTDASAYIYMR